MVTIRAIRMRNEKLENKKSRVRFLLTFLFHKKTACRLEENHGRRLRSVKRQKTCMVLLPSPFLKTAIVAQIFEPLASGEWQLATTLKCVYNRVSAIDIGHIIVTLL